MKKSSFVTLISGSVSVVLFALGMCMALLPEWNAFTQGVILGAAGLIVGLITVIVRFKMEKKSLPKISGKTVLFTIFGIIGILTFGAGLCLCLVWEQIIWGTLLGLFGIILLISLIPMGKGIQ